MAISIKVNLANDSAWDATKTFEDLDPGVYKVKTTGVEIHTKEGKQSLKISFETLDPVKGKPGDIYIGLDFTKEANRRKLLTAMISHGAKEEKIKAMGAALEITDSIFLGKEALVNVRLVDDVDEKGRKRLNDREFIRAQDYEVLRARHSANGPAKAPTGAPQPAAAAPAAAAPPASAASLFE